MIKGRDAARRMSGRNVSSAIVEPTTPGSRPGIVFSAPDWSLSQATEAMAKGASSTSWWSTGAVLWVSSRCLGSCAASCAAGRVGRITRLGGPHQDRYGAECLAVSE